MRADTVTEKHEQPQASQQRQGSQALLLFFELGPRDLCLLVFLNFGSVETVGIVAAKQKE